MDYQIMSEHLKNAARIAEEIAAKQIELDSILELVFIGPLNDNAV